MSFMQQEADLQRAAWAEIQELEANGPPKENPTNQDYNKWKLAHFGGGYSIWHEGLETSGMSGLTGNAREWARVMLLKGLELKDPHAAQLLGAMGDKSVLPELRAQLPEATGENKVRLAAAIYALEPEPEQSLASHLIDVLQHGEHQHERMNAAIELRKFEGPEVEKALRDAKEGSADFLVKYHAGGSLGIIESRKAKEASVEEKPADNDGVGEKPADKGMEEKPANNGLKEKPADKVMGEDLVNLGGLKLTSLKLFNYSSAWLSYNIVLPWLSFKLAL
ncbi:hypothetical protein G7Y89_g4640 [Cudoniella acicularis]|uniref:HEAT repeat domain-containing protein n=1 Tax=Cudoniella acicularis TaxID=354080 RepID=A0A8H4RQG6_9HELO|nr:hypothetical protein G7Y89_g4640 [Cudoniella acicularis]